jgi:hypothetical protein
MSRHLGGGVIGPVIDAVTAIVEMYTFSPRMAGY